MALGHLGPVEGQQVVVGEDLDAVVVPERRGTRDTRSIQEEAEETKPSKRQIIIDLFPLADIITAKLS